MSCQLVSDHLGGYLDGELTVLVRTEFETHLLRCRGCFVLVDTCRRTIHVYRFEPAPLLPAALHRKLMDNLPASPPRVDPAHPTH